MAWFVRGRLHRPFHLADFFVNWAVQTTSLVAADLTAQACAMSVSHEDECEVVDVVPCTSIEHLNVISREGSGTPPDSQLIRTQLWLLGLNPPCDAEVRTVYRKRFQFSPMRALRWLPVAAVLGLGFAAADALVVPHSFLGALILDIGVLGGLLPGAIVATTALSCRSLKAGWDDLNTSDKFAASFFPGCAVVLLVDTSLLLLGPVPVVVAACVETLSRYAYFTYVTHILSSGRAYHTTTTKAARARLRRYDGPRTFVWPAATPTGTPSLLIPASLRPRLPPPPPPTPPREEAEEVVDDGDDIAWDVGVGATLKPSPPPSPVPDPTGVEQPGSAPPEVKKV